VTPMLRRLIFWGALAAMLVASLVFAFRPQPVAVDLTTIARGGLEITAGDEGETRIHDIYVLSAPVAGQMQRIDTHVGDPVVALETVIASIEPIDPDFLDPRSEAQAQADIRAADAAEALARAEVEQAEAELDFARTELERARKLIQENTISQRDLDEAERSFRTRRAALATALAGLNVAAFQLERAKAQMLSPVQTQNAKGDCACVDIMAPVDGQILRIVQQSAGVVAQGAPLVEIGDPTKLEIVVDLLSSDAVKVRSGQRVIIEAWGGEPLEGRVRLVEPFGYTKVSALGIEEQRVNVIVDFVSPMETRARLAHGYQVDTRIILAAHEDVLTLPITALFRDGDAWAVFAEVENRAQLRIVTIGPRNATDALVVDGVHEGDRVVLHPSDRVLDGVRITDRRG
jgi:HlyD family secretion protein